MTPELKPKTKQKLKKLTPSQIQRHDINQKIVHNLTNMESKLILFSIIKKSLSAADICAKQKIPLSTVYSKLQTLEELSLAYVERIELSKEGHKVKYYKSRVRGIEISISKSEPKLFLIKNPI